MFFFLSYLNPRHRSATPNVSRRTLSRSLPLAQAIISLWLSYFYFSSFSSNPPEKLYVFRLWRLRRNRIHWPRLWKNVVLTLHAAFWKWMKRHHRRGYIYIYTYKRERERTPLSISLYTGFRCKKREIKEPRGDFFLGTSFRLFGGSERVIDGWRAGHPAAQGSLLKALLTSQ